MKQIQLCVPDDQAELFADKLAALVKEYGGDIDTSNKSNPFLYNDKIPIWERIKTVEDAIAYTGMTLPENIEDLPLDVQAMLKLRIICAAYNKLKADQLDQFPKFTIGEYRYYPWFYLYTQEEIDAMNEEDRSRVLGRSYSYAGASAGVAFSDTLRLLELEHVQRRSALLQNGKTRKRVRKAFLETLGAIFRLYHRRIEEIPL